MGTQHDALGVQQESAFADCVWLQPQSQVPPVQHLHESHVHEEHEQSVQAQESPQQHDSRELVPAVAPSMEADRRRVRAKPMNMAVSFRCAGAGAPAVSE